MSEGPFIHGERELVTSLGLTQKAVRAVRADELERAIDWDTIAGEVRYSDAGRARLLLALKIERDAPPAADPAVVAPGLLSRVRDAFKKNPEHEPAEAPSAPAPAPARVEAPPAAAAPKFEDLVCHKRYVPNRHIVEAKRANGDLVLVRVKDNTNLQPGMTMKCRFGSGRVWELAQRLPRKRGRW